MSEFTVDGPTPGLCIHIERRQVCTRMQGHDGEHLMVPDTLSFEERFHAIAARFPVSQSTDQGRHADGSFICTNCDGFGCDACEGSGTQPSDPSQEVDHG